MRTLTLGFLAVAAVILDCYCSNEATLQSDLMGVYNTNVAPKNGTDVIDVAISMGVLFIVEFNEIKETITGNYFVRLQWTDVNLIWIPSDYGNVTKTVFKQKQLWLPDISMQNGVHGIGHLGDDDFIVYVTYDGTMKWGPMSTAETICKVNTEYFPYDKQSCSVTLINRDVTGNINVTISNPSVINDGFIENGQWELTSTSTEDVSIPRYPQLMYFRLHLTRRQEYYVSSLIMPTLFVSVLNCCVLMLPSTSGEKISFSITVFLSYMVLLTFTADYLPRTSENEPHLVKYIGIMLGLSFASVICSVISVLIEHVLMKSKADKLDDVIDDTPSRDTDTPIISTGSATESSTYTRSTHIKSNMTEIKAKPAWGEEELRKSDTGQHLYCSKREPITLQVKELKIFIRKCLCYFDIIASVCIILTTVCVTLSTMTTLSNGN